MRAEKRAIVETDGSGGENLNKKMQIKQLTKTQKETEEKKKNKQISSGQKMWKSYIINAILRKWHSSRTHTLMQAQRLIHTCIYRKAQRRKELVKESPERWKKQHKCNYKGLRHFIFNHSNISKNEHHFQFKITSISNIRKILPAKDDLHTVKSTFKNQCESSSKCWDAETLLHLKN